MSQFIFKGESCKQSLCYSCLMTFVTRKFHAYFTLQCHIHFNSQKEGGQKKLNLGSWLAKFVSHVT